MADVPELVAQALYRDAERDAQARAVLAKSREKYSPWWEIIASVITGASSALVLQSLGQDWSTAAYVGVGVAGFGIAMRTAREVGQLNQRLEAALTLLAKERTP